MEKIVFYRHMNIGFEWILQDKEHIKKLTETVKGKFADHFELTEVDISQEFIQWLSDHNLTIGYAELFYCSPKGNIFLHKDEINPPNVCKINWVYDQGETWMRWFSLKEGSELKQHRTNLGGIYYTANEGDYKFETKTNIGRPTLVNAYELHDVVNLSDHDRWCISIVPRFSHLPGSRLSMQEAIEIFKPYFS